MYILEVERNKLKSLYMKSDVIKEIKPNLNEDNPNLNDNYNNNDYLMPFIKVLYKVFLGSSK